MLPTKILIRRRVVILGLMLGIFLAFSMLVSAFISADYFATLNVMRTVKSTHIDSEYTIDLFSYTNIDDIVGNVSEIDYVENVAVGRSTAEPFFKRGNISNRWREYWYIVDLSHPKM